MAVAEHAWPAGAFDAIAIWGEDCRCTIQGIDGDQVRLVGDLGEDQLPDPWLGMVGRWLMILAPGSTGRMQLTLQLPRNQSWAVGILAGLAHFKASGIQAHLRLMLGMGDVEIEDCRGVFAVESGSADVRLKHFTEAEMPEIPHLPLDTDGPADGPEDWPEWIKNTRTQADGKLGEEIRRFFKPTGVAGQHPGVNVQVGKGSLRLEDADARTCLVGFGKGNAKLEGGRIADLEVGLGGGDIECESCMPTGHWAVKTDHGDIRLALPSDAVARLDVATRRGEIRSGMPLVRVPRQGPEASQGGRMVGTIGSIAADRMPDVHLTTLYGDIKIESRPEVSKYSETPTAETASSPEPAAEGGESTVRSAEASAAAAETDEQPEDHDGSSARLVHDTQVGILKALSAGRISTEEADQLLGSLGT